MPSIPGATSNFYELQPEDVGYTLHCRVTATNLIGSASANSNMTGPIMAGAPLPVAPSNTIAPAIADITPVEDEVLHCTTGTWDGDAPITFAYQWKRGATNVGTSSADYTLVTADVGANMSCTVTATNAAGSASADSTTVGPVTAAGGGTSTWNPADKTASLVLSGGDLVAEVDPSGGAAAVRGTVSLNAGKKYFEVTLTSYTYGDGSDDIYVGIADSSHALGSAVPGNADSAGVCYWVYNGYYISLTASGFVIVAHAAGSDVIGVAVDLDTHDIWFSKNGTWLQGDPGTGATPFDWGDTAGAMFPYVGMKEIVAPVKVTLNVGPTFIGTLPTGFTAWG